MKKFTSFLLPTKTDIRIGRFQNEFELTTHQAQESRALRPSRIRVIMVAFLCFVGLGVLLFRVISLQALQASSLEKKANNNRIRMIYHDAPRGAIIDRYGVVLAENAPDIGVYLTRADLPKNDNQLQSVFEKISSVTKTPIENIQQSLFQLAEENRPAVEPALVIPHITHEQAIALTVDQDELPGVHISPRIIRNYPKKEAFAHILGYVGKMDPQSWEEFRTQTDYFIDDAIGKSGLEKTYEKSLKGTHEKETIEVDAMGHIIRTVSSESAKTGSALTLSVDAELQQLLYDQLHASTRQLHAKAASAVALDPRNGEVLALVSYPSFDNNVFPQQNVAEIQRLVTDADSNPLFDRAISAEYPSGSTIKPVIAAAALEEHIITPATTVQSVGGIQINQWFFPDWKSGGHGTTNVIKAIAESVNTFFYSVGGGYGNISGLGVDKIREYAEKFGLNNETGVDLPNEASGFLPTKEWKETTKKEPWYIGDTYHLSIGQGDLLVTPLQVASYTATIGNGGTMYIPHLKKTSPDDSQQYIKKTQVVSGATLATVQDGMRQTVLSGSAKSFQSLPIPVAAKTGTAQFGTQNKTHAWFTCYAPFNDPKIVIVVMIEGGGEGSSTAAPIAKTALDWWASHRLNHVDN